MSATDRDLTVDDYVQAVANGLPRNIAERSAMAIPGGLTQDERDELRGRLDALTVPEVADATAPETSLEPPRSAQQPPAGIPGPPEGSQGHTGPRGEPTSRIIAMIVSRSSTRCSECGGSAFPGYGDDHAHVMTSGYDQRKGCGATWTHITTDAMGDGAKATAQSLAPHLPWIDLRDVVRQPLHLGHGGLPAKAQRRIETLTGLLAVRERELASVTAQRDQARDEVQRLRIFESASVGAHALLDDAKTEVHILRDQLKAADRRADQRAEGLRCLLSEALDEAERLGTPDETGTERPRLREIRREEGL